MKSPFRQLFESSPDAMVIVDTRGRILRANARAASLFGYGPAQLDGRFIEVLFPGQENLPSGSPGLGKQGARRVELVGSRGDSSQFPAEIGIVPLRTRRSTATVLTIRDITEAQRARFLLERSLDLVESEGLDRRALIGRLIRAQQEERAWLAANIHDDTIQMISATSLSLPQLRLRLRTEDELAILDKWERTVRLSLSRLRRLIFDLRLSGVERSVAAAIRADLERLRSDTGISYRLDDRFPAPTPVTATVQIYRIAREALVNVRKHARADTVRVQVLDVDHGCLVTIVDDGIGYSPADVENRPGHLGLVLMRERAQLSGGWCRIESAPGAGTTVEFWTPLDGDPLDGDPAQPERAGECAAESVPPLAAISPPLITRQTPPDWTTGLMSKHS
jgi:PAS domain S-box-containing protein